MISLGLKHKLFFPLSLRCEEFSTYPRTYDLLHGAGVLSAVMRSGCSLRSLLVEMDRVLRPAGFLVLRDSPALIQAVSERAQSMIWTVVAGPRAVSVDNASSGEEEEEVLVIRKDYWTVEQE